MLRSVRTSHLHLSPLLQMHHGKPVFMRETLRTVLFMPLVPLAWQHSKTSHLHAACFPSLPTLFFSPFFRPLDYLVYIFIPYFSFFFPSVRLRFYFSVLFPSVDRFLYLRWDERKKEEKKREKIRKRREKERGEKNKGGKRRGEKQKREKTREEERRGEEESRVEDKRKKRKRKKKTRKWREKMWR